MRFQSARGNLVQTWNVATSTNFVRWRRIWKLDTALRIASAFECATLFRIAEKKAVRMLGSQVESIVHRPTQLTMRIVESSCLLNTQSARKGRREPHRATSRAVVHKITRSNWG
jgi:hypothetical protein